MTTAGSIVTDVAYFLGVKALDTGGATARTEHSYGYTTRFAQIYNGSSWDWYYAAQSRQWYAYAWASFIDTNGQTHPGYDQNHYHQLVHQDTSPNYYKDSVLCQKAYDIWFYNSMKQYEAW